jgi:hypothetical protein
MSREIVSFVYEPPTGAGATHVTVYDGGNRFSVIWSDLIANEWEEHYDSLAVALVRVSALIHCGANGWKRGFTSSAEEFQGAAESFLQGVTG